MANTSIAALMEKIGANSRKDQGLYVRGLSEMRHKFLGKNAGMKTADLRKQAESVRGRAKEPCGLLDALVGISFHDDANVAFERFLVTVANDCAKEGGALRKLTPEDIIRRFSRYEQSANVGTHAVELEQSALKYYDDSLRLGIEDKYFSHGIYYTQL